MIEKLSKQRNKLLISLYTATDHFFIFFLFLSLYVMYFFVYNKATVDLQHRTSDIFALSLYIRHRRSVSSRNVGFTFHTHSVLNVDTQWIDGISHQHCNFYANSLHFCTYECCLRNCQRMCSNCRWLAPLWQWNLLHCTHN